MALRVRDIMSKDPLTVSTNDSLSEIIYKLSSYNIEHLPVVDELNKFVGILSKTDLYHKAMNLAQNTSGSAYNTMILDNSKASEIMTLNPVTVDPEEPITSAIKLLLQGNFHALPVLEEESVVGIISSQDILESLLKK